MVLKYILTLILGSGLLVGFYTYEQDLSGQALTEHDKKYCLQIGPSYFESKCLDSLYNVKEAKCSRLPDNILKTKCKEELETINISRQKASKNYLPLLFESVAIFFLARFLFGGLQFEVLEKYYQLPVMGKLFLKFNELGNEDTNIFIRLVVMSLAYIILLSLHFLFYYII